MKRAGRVFLCLRFSSGFVVINLVTFCNNLQIYKVYKIHFGIEIKKVVEMRAVTNPTRAVDVIKCLSLGDTHAIGNAALRLLRGSSSCDLYQITRGLPVWADLLLLVEMRGVEPLSENLLI